MSNGLATTEGFYHKEYSYEIPNLYTHCLKVINKV